jgi:hypothetical protein
MNRGDTYDRGPLLDAVTVCGPHAETYSPIMQWRHRFSFARFRELRHRMGLPP